MAAQDDIGGSVVMRVEGDGGARGPAQGHLAQLGHEP